MATLPNSLPEQPKYTVSIPGHGTLTGYTFDSAIRGIPTTHRFTQVPYALPVESNDRFKIAKPIPKDYDYTGDYGKVGLRCYQPGVDNPLFQYDKQPSQEFVQYSNIFIPAGKIPEGGWPVLIYLHGGWLQYNEPNRILLSTNDLNADFAKRFILVCPGYRLNIFGFLSSKELLEEDEKSSNFGFWDQRMAIEWTAKYIKYFGGNPEKLTVGGLSAGAYSNFFQLAYELYHPEEPQLIKQAFFHSNLVYVQPKTIAEVQSQFDEIIERLGIDRSMPSHEKLEKLRKIEPGFFEDFIPTLKMHTFRAVTDDKFVSSQLIKELNNGQFTERLIKKNIRLLIGEVDNEAWKYSMLNTPVSKDDLKVQVENYYPSTIVEPLLTKYPEFEALEESDPDFNEKLRIIFGEITSDGQVYASERGFISKLVFFNYPSELIYRYRISYRAKFLDKILSPEHKVIHALDTTLWFYQIKEYSDSEISIAKNWMDPYLEFLNFETVTKWQSGDYRKFNLLKANGDIEYAIDNLWERGIEVAQKVYDSQLT